MERFSTLPSPNIVNFVLGGKDLCVVEWESL